MFRLSHVSVSSQDRARPPSGRGGVPAWHRRTAPMERRRKARCTCDKGNPEVQERQQLLQYINLQLIAAGLPAARRREDLQFAQVASGLIERFHETSRLLSEHRCPADRRIESFLERHFTD